MSPRRPHQSALDEELGEVYRIGRVHIGMRHSLADASTLGQTVCYVPWALTPRARPASW
jgi:hypothetical protein